VWAFAKRILLPVWFAVWTHSKFEELNDQPGALLGVDARIYYRAAHAFLAGGNPWTAQADGFVFAAPPPTLIPFIPLTILPEDAVVFLGIGGSALVAIALIRMFRLPWYWLLFPPLFEAVWVANPNPFVVWLLVRGTTGGAILGVFLKVYAILPLLGELRVRAIVGSVAFLAVTLPILPWGSYQAQSSQLADILLDQSQGGRSALSFPLLLPLTVLALISFDRRTAGWLAVPALWPATQLHYSLLALPVVHPIMAVFFCIPAPGFQALGIIIYAGWAYLGRGGGKTALWREVADLCRRGGLLMRRTIGEWSPKRRHLK
jgi:hypothetical protein